jgi:phage tail-like protein
VVKCQLAQEGTFKEADMAQFAVNPTRFDPYKNFKFRVQWDGKYIPGISLVSPLDRTTEVVEHREGNEPNVTRKSPGITRYEPITMERGVTHDGAFENWANMVYRYGAGAGSEVALKDFRKDIIIELCNEAGQVVKRYKVYRCWVSEYQALPEMDADDGCIAFESITLQTEGWERDTDTTEPVEPGSSS